MDARVTTVILACLIAALCAVPSADAAQRIVPSAYQVAAHHEGIPVALLWAVALQESGLVRDHREVPWPWTLNVAGAPARFATRERACRALYRALRRVPSTRIDVGLTQINLGYHGKRVSTPCELLDPYRNLAVASTLLLELHQAGESWISTAGRYHRPAGGAEATRYCEAVQHRLMRIAHRARTCPARRSRA